MEQVMQQGGPPSQPRPGSSGAAPQGQASPSAMGVKGSAPKRDVPIERIQEELGRGVNALSTALYSNQKTSDAIMGMVNEQEKVGSVAKAAVFATTQVMDKGDIAERVAAPLTALAVDEIIQMSEATGMEFSEEESKQALMSAQEMLLSAYGVSEERARALAEQASPEARKRMESIYSEQGGPTPSPQEQESA